MKELFLSALGTGYLRPASGTWGSLAALPAAWALHVIGGPILLGIAAVFACVLGIAILNGHNAATQDPSWVVIDEVVGQWVAILPVSIGAARVGADVLQLWPGIVSAFILFRAFDVLKPWPIRLMDQRHDAYGIMLDDVLAGIAAAICVLALAALAHGIR